MLYRDIAKVLGAFLIGFSLTMLVPLGMAFYYEFVADPELHPQPHSTVAFVFSIIITAILGGGLYLLGRGSVGNLYRREGLALAVVIWLITPAVAALPFGLSGTLTSPAQAYFEMTSGLTTTGATVIAAKEYDAATGREIAIERTFCGVLDTTYVFYGNVAPVLEAGTNKVLYKGIDAIGHALLFWRSQIQWMGGLGIILLFITILPALGVGGKVMYQAEQTGPVKTSLTPRLKESAAQLWKIYLGLTIFLIAILMITNENLGWFDSITIAFSTISTAGFSVHNESIGYYQNSATEWVVIIFMILGAVNFTLYYFVINAKLFRLYDPELLLFLALLLSAFIIGIPFLVGTPNTLLTGKTEIFDWHSAIRHGIFEITSAFTTTGFFIADYDIWPYGAQAVLLIVQYFGGMTGSTAGGIKILRILILFRVAQYKIESLFRPETVKILRVGENEVDGSSANLVLCFFLTAIAVSVAGALYYITSGIDPETAIGLVANFVNNTGVTFRMAGPTGTCAFMTDIQLMFSSLLMIIGRLEYFAFFAILVPAFWKQN